MKIYLNIFIALVLLAVGYIFGSTNYEIESAAKVDGLTKGKLYDFGGFDESQYVGEIDTSQIAKVIQHNEWRNLGCLRRPIKDVRLGIEFSDGTKIRFAGGYFTISGVPGYFFIQESQASRANDLYGELLQKIVIPHRMK